MQRANGEVRRAQILAASGQLVRRRGFTATRMADVAAEIGLSAPLIVYHFRTKDELMAATLAAEARGELERLEAVAAAPLDPLAKLSRVVHLSLGAASVGDWALWIDAWGEGLRSVTMRHHLADLDRRWLAAIEAIIADGEGTGAFTVRAPAASAERIMALLDGYGVQLVRAGSVRARQRVLAAGRAAVGEELGVTLGTR